MIVDVTKISHAADLLDRLEIGNTARIQQDGHRVTVSVGNQCASAARTFLTSISDTADVKIPTRFIKALPSAFPGNVCVVNGKLTYKDICLTIPQTDYVFDPVQPQGDPIVENGELDVDVVASISDIGRYVMDYVDMDRFKNADKVRGLVNVAVHGGSVVATDTSTMAVISGVFGKNTPTFALDSHALLQLSNVLRHSRARFDLYGNCIVFRNDYGSLTIATSDNPLPSDWSRLLPTQPTKWHVSCARYDMLSMLDVIIAASDDGRTQVKLSADGKGKLNGETLQKPLVQFSIPCQGGPFTARVNAERMRDALTFFSSSAVNIDVCDADKNMPLVISSKSGHGVERQKWVVVARLEARNG